jgi:hypothetical protein
MGKFLSIFLNINGRRNLFLLFFTLTLKPSPIAAIVDRLPNSTRLELKTGYLVADVSVFQFLYLESCHSSFNTGVGRVQSVV